MKGKTTSVSEIVLTCQNIRCFLICSFLIVCRKLSVTVDSSDDNYLPSKIVIQGGEMDNLRTLNTVNLDW